MGFKSNKERIQEADQQGTSVSHPYLGYGQLIGMSFDKRIVDEGTDQERTYNNIVFRVRLEGDKDREGGETPPGAVYTHVEYELDDERDDSAKKAEAAATRIEFILKRLISPQIAEKIMALTDTEAENIPVAWKIVGDRIEKLGNTFKEKSKYAQLPRRHMKLCGNVWQGSGKVRWKPYPGFIAKQGEETAFTPREIQENNEYLSWLATSSTPNNRTAAYTAPSGGENLDAVEDLGDLDA